MAKKPRCKLIGVQAMSEAYSAAPAALTNLPNFVVWRLEDNDGRKTKIPYQLNGRMPHKNKFSLRDGR